MKESWVAVVAAAVMAVIAFAAAACGGSDQEVPDSAATATAFLNSEITVEILPDPASSSTDAAIRIQPTTVTELGPPIINVDVFIAGASGVSAFDLTLGYDDSLLEFVEREASDFIAASPRGSGLSCPEPVDEGGTVNVVCVTTGPPLCLGGRAGASGSGVLATLSFRPLRPGRGQLVFIDAKLVGDDLRPCDPAVGDVYRLPSTTTDAEVVVSVLQ